MLKLVYNNIKNFLSIKKTVQICTVFFSFILLAAATTVVAIVISAAAEDKDYKDDYPQAVVVAEASVTKA